VVGVGRAGEARERVEEKRVFVGWSGGAESRDEAGERGQSGLGFFDV